MRRPTRKYWPRSWKQANAGGTVTLKGRGIEKEFSVLPSTVEAGTPEQLRAEVERMMVEGTTGQRPS